MAWNACSENSDFLEFTSLQFTIRFETTCKAVARSTISPSSYRLRAPTTYRFKERGRELGGKDMLLASHPEMRKGRAFSHSHTEEDEGGRRNFYCKSQGIIGMTGISCNRGENLCDGKEFLQMSYGKIIRVY